MQKLTNVDQAAGWLLPGAEKDRQSVTADWKPVGRALIEGVELREARSVPKRSGLVTELYRADWYADAAGVGQVFIARLHPGGISAWHAHAATIDRLTIVLGTATVVLFDVRPSSPTLGLVNEFHLDEHRPTTIVVPPQVWHGVQNSGASACIIANMPDRPYRYEDPDHWRVPPDSRHIPYSFATHARVTEAI